MRTEKELAYITQDLLDWMSSEQKEKRHIPTVEEMYLWLLKGYDVVFGDEALEELRDAFIAECEV